MNSREHDGTRSLCVDSETGVSRRVTMRWPLPIPVFSLFKFDSVKARAQQATIIEYLEKSGVEIVMAQPVGDCWDQCYVRDIGSVISHCFFVARPKRPDRRRNSPGRWSFIWIQIQHCIRRHRFDLSFRFPTLGPRMAARAF